MNKYQEVFEELLDDLHCEYDDVDGSYLETIKELVDKANETIKIINECLPSEVWETCAFKVIKELWKDE